MAEQTYCRFHDLFDCPFAHGPESEGRGPVPLVDAGLTPADYIDPGLVVAEDGLSLEDCSDG